jgi:hypothetical protein
MIARNADMSYAKLRLWSVRFHDDVNGAFTSRGTCIAEDPRRCPALPFSKSLID